MDSNENSHPHNPYAPEAGEQVPNQYGQYPSAMASYSAPAEGTPVPQGTAGYTTNQPPVASRLSVDVVAPTHFDNQNPTVMQPVPQQETEPKATKQSPGRIIAIIIPSVIALICLVVGVWAIVSMISKDDQIKALQQTLNDQTEIITTIEQKTGNNITSANDLPNVVPLSEYIYINEWGIKLHIPNNLVNISYVLNQNYRQTICFNGRQADIVTFPAFADVRQNPGGMGCLMRVSSQEGDVDSGTGVKFGTKVFSSDGYNYFYIAPTALFSTDPAEQGQENTAVQLIKTMLSTENISTY